MFESSEDANEYAGRLENSAVCATSQGMRVADMTWLLRNEEYMTLQEEARRLQEVLRREGLEIRVRQPDIEVATE